MLSVYPIDTPVERSVLYVHLKRFKVTECVTRTQQAKADHSQQYRSLTQTETYKAISFIFRIKKIGYCILGVFVFVRHEKKGSVGKLLCKMSVVL